MDRAPSAAMVLTTGALYRLRCAGEDIAARPALHARLFDAEPALREQVADFVESWRGASGAIAMCALMARRAGSVKFDALAFLRMIGRDIAENPLPWSGLVNAQPPFAEDCARLTQALRAALATNSSTAYA